MSRFSHALVTGGGGGLGRGFALDLARRGLDVTITDVSRDGAEETAEKVRGLGRSAHVEPLDVRDAAAFEQVAERAEATLGPVDFVVNNAGIMVGGGIGQLTLEQFRRVIDINLFGVIHGYHVFTPRFRERQRGHFVNVASIAGILSTPETSPYNISKAGVISLSETAYAELGKWNIGTTVLCPSAVRTGLMDRIESDNPMHRRLALKNAAQGGPRDPEHVAHITVSAAFADELYVFPQLDAAMAWRVKRLFPRSFARLARLARNRAWLEKSASGKR